MKKKDLTDLRRKEVEDLNQLYGKKKLELLKTKAEVKVSKEKNLKKMKNLRREISQILTVIKENELLKVQEDSKEEEK